MSVHRKTAFLPYRPKKILNKSIRADHWFWTRYSAYPYLGCQHGCEFCYCRETKYSPYENINDFPYLIKVKENGAELLRKELKRVPFDPIFTGDYQPLEKKFEISRKMLMVCADLGFPVMILERSPLVVRDLDVIQSIHSAARAVVAFSVIYTESSSRAQIIRQLENLAPPPARRFAAMEKFAAKGILTGVSMMPLLPGLCDDPSNLEEIIKATADHGGKFALASTLTLSDQQRGYFLKVLAERFPHLLTFFEKIYPVGQYVPSTDRWKTTALLIAELCQKHGLSDRMPRPVIPGEKKEFNKRLVEKLANQAYLLDLLGHSKSAVWNFRKAAWAVEDLEQDIRLIYRSMGRSGLCAIPNLGGESLQMVEKAVLAPVEMSSLTL